MKPEHIRESSSTIAHQMTSILSLKPVYNDSLHSPLGGLTCIHQKTVLTAPHHA